MVAAAAAAAETAATIGRRQRRLLAARRGPRQTAPLLPLGRRALDFVPIVGWEECRRQSVCARSCIRGSRSLPIQFESALLAVVWRAQWPAHHCAESAAAGRFSFARQISLYRAANWPALVCARAPVRGAAIRRRPPCTTAQPPDSYAHLARLATLELSGRTTTLVAHHHHHHLASPIRPAAARRAIPASGSPLGQPLSLWSLHNCSQKLARKFAKHCLSELHWWRCNSVHSKSVQNRANSVRPSRFRACWTPKGTRLD